jgi:hypothetical protein
MSDAVRVPTEAEAAVIKWLSETDSYGLRMERLIGDLENEADILPWLVAAYNLAASPSVGGWGDISTAPKDGVTEAECLRIDQLPFDLAMKVYRALGFQRRSTPPPSSVSTGSRPQEAVPTEQAEAAVVARVVQK